MTTYGLASRLRIELAKLETSEIESKKFQLNLPARHMKTWSKGKEVQEKSQEEIHKEASGQEDQSKMIS